MAIEQTDPPTQGADEPFAAFAQRHATWWQAEDVRLRREQMARWDSMLASVGASVEPTLAAWQSFDGRLAGLVAALNTAQPQGTGFNEAFLKWLLPLVMRLPAPDATGG